MTKHILIVEDNPTIAYALEYVLDKNGYIVHVVDTIRRAKAIIQTHDIDMILLDNNLPDGRGIDLLYELRVTNDDQIPVIIMSGTNRREFTDRLLTLGANYFLHKPINMDELLNLVEHWTAQDVAN